MRSVRGTGRGKAGVFSFMMSFFAVSAIGFGLTGSLAISQPPPVPGNAALSGVYAEHPAVTGKPVSPATEAVAAPGIQVPVSVRQGEVLKVHVNDRSRFAQASGNGTVSLADRKVDLFPQKDGSLLALVPVSVFQTPGSYALKVFDSADNLVNTYKVTIQDAHYRTQNVTVSKTTEGLQPLPGELEAIQALKDTVSSVKYWSEPFMSPTIDCQNSPFGVKRLHNGIPTGDYHKGVDLRSPAGRPIHAISGGKVQIARMYRLHGGTVGLDHGQGVGSIYIHMSRLNVKPGDLVKKGDVIGYVGSTGFATGPHLHWGMYVSGLPVNPNQWIAGVPKCR